MSEDTIPLPSELAASDRRLYRGHWLTEMRESAVLSSGRNILLREIWVRLPSGKDKKWRTNEPFFSALEGHEVGALVAIDGSGNETLIGMVNFATDERRIFWNARRAGFGCTPWALLFLSFGLVEVRGFVFLVIWLLALALMVLTAISRHTAAKRTLSLDAMRLDTLAATCC